MKPNRSIVQGALLDTKQATGLLLALITSVMKSLKSNNPAPFAHFMRERLHERRDRRALNVMLNNWATVLASSIGKRNRAMKIKSLYDSVPVIIGKASDSASIDPAETSDKTRLELVMQVKEEIRLRLALLTSLVKHND
jgi:hypothetical protein